MRYSFMVFTRPGESGMPSLPPAVAAQHEEMQAGRGRQGIAFDSCIRCSHPIP